MRTVLDVSYGKNDWEKVDFYLPESDRFDTVFWIHGGGIENGNRRSFDFAEDFVCAGYAVASVEYRLYPQAHFPEFIADCANAAAFCLEKLPDFGGNGQMIVSGQSAGAYITCMLYMNPRFFADAGVDVAKIKAFVSDSAQVTAHFNVLRERGLDSRLERIDETAPIYYLNEKTALKPLLLIYYSDDMPCRGTQNRLFYESFHRFFADPPVSIAELPGTHCAGSCNRNEKGTFDYVDTALAFLKSIGEGQNGSY